MSSDGLHKSFFRGKQEFRHFFDSYYTALRSFAFSFLQDYAEAEDHVQEAFIKLWEKSGNFLSEQAAKAFLYKSVKNSCLNQLEHSKVIHKHREYSLNYTEINHLADNRIIEEEVHRMIYQAINELPAQCRNVLVLSINGAKNSEIASELMVSVNTVKTQKKIAYKQLKIKLQDIYPAILFLGVSLT